MLALPGEGGSTASSAWVLSAAGREATIAEQVFPARWTVGTCVSGRLFISLSLTVSIVGALVTRTVRQHLNLNNSEQLCR